MRFFVLILLSGTVMLTAAQEKKSRESEKSKERMSKGRQDALRREAAAEEKYSERPSEREPKRNAYGGKKESEGKELGTTRSARARHRLLNRMMAAMETRLRARDALSELESTLEAAKTRLNQQKKDGHMPSGVLQQKEERIRQAEEKINALRSKLRAFGSMIDAQSEKEME